MDITFRADTLSRLMPMHIVIGPDLRIRQAGPTLKKISGATELIGKPIDAVFDLRRPTSSTALFGLSQKEFARLQMALRQHPETSLKGQIVLLEDGCALIDLSFGISVVDAVARFGLTVGDFAVTDLAVEMLYLVEAKTAVTKELRKLNQRLQGAQIAAQEQAFTDTLTGLKNRRAMDHVLSRLIGDERPFGLMHLDLDFFKQVNDSLGHAAGDHVLQHVAQILVASARKTDTVVRFGGDEFVLIFDGLINRDKLDAIAQRLIRKLEEPIPFSERVCRISGSIGITLSSFYAQPQIERMLHDADMALYRSKDRGRACISWADEAADAPLQQVS